MKSADDPTGASVASMVGVGSGTPLAVPALPAGGLVLAVGGGTFDTIGTVLIVSVRSVLLLPMALLSLPAVRARGPLAH